MKIKITAIIPVEENNRPILGEIYEVKRSKSASARLKLFFVEVNGIEVGVYENQECKVVDNE